MKVRSLLEVLLYLVLVLACAFLFLLQTIQDYREGLASISVSQESVSLKDMPTIIICWVGQHTHEKKKVTLTSNMFHMSMGGTSSLI